MNLKKEIVKAVLARFRTIHTPDYHTDLGDHFYLFRSGAFQDHELPAGNIIVGDSDPDGEFVTSDQNVTDYLLNLRVDLFCKSGSTSWEQLEDMIADVKKAIGVNDRWTAAAPLLTADIVTTVPGKETVIMEEEGAGVQLLYIVAGGTIDFTIHFRTDKWAEE